MAKRYVQFDSSCRFVQYTDALEHMLHHLNKMMSEIPSIPQIMVTSVNDKGHSKVPLSRHYTNEAIDIRTHNFTDALQKYTFLNQYLARLNKDPEAIKADCFWGQLEDPGVQNEHIHVQVAMGKKYE